MLGLELRPRELGQAAERHVQDVVRLDLAELELLHQLAARLVRVLRPPDHPDDGVEVVQGDQQSLDDVVALLGLLQLEARAPRDDVDLVVDVVPDDLRHVQGARHAVDEREHDHPEAVLQLCVLVELVEHDLRVRAALQLDHESHALAPARVVVDVRDVLHAARAVQLRDLLRQARLVDLVGQLRDDDPLPAAGPLLDRADRADLDGAAPGLVGVLDPVTAHHDRAGREVRTLDELHQVAGLGLGVVDEVDDAVDHLAEVVGRDVRRHPHRDPAGAVHQQVREARGQDDGLLFVAVVVRDEVDGLGLDVAEHLERHGRETCLRVPHGSWRVAVDGAEVPVRVDERMPEREVLPHPNQRVVDGFQAVGVVLLHDLTDRPRRLAVRAIRPQPALEHRPEDPAVDGLQAVPHLGQRAPHDDRHRVVEVRTLDLVLELDVLDPAGEQGFLRHRQTSRFSTSAALSSIHSLREATSSPISTLNSRSAVAASSSVTRSSVRRSGSIVVSHS